MNGKLTNGLNFKNGLKYIANGAIFILNSFIVLLLFSIITAGTPDKIISTETAYETISEIRLDRREKIESYLESLHKQANSIQKDEFMNSFFRTKKEYSEFKKTDSVLSLSLINDLNKMEMEVLYQHIERYSLFYDILFIDTDGEIFHTILKQKDYKKNIHGDELAKTSLSQKIRMKPLGSFVDFQYYEASNEPSAFFVEPVNDSTGIIGWYAFQVSINKLNNLLSVNDQLGITGEALLVNRSQLMLNNLRYFLFSE